jgi:putative redox protein
MDMKMTFPGGAKVNAQFKGFTVATDQPIEEQGGGTAPAPFDFFLVSLGTCTAYYVLMFCQRNALSTKEITLVMKDERNPMTHLIETIHIDIKVPEGFPEKYHKALIRSAEVCTVKRNLEKPPTFAITVTKQ